MKAPSIEITPGELAQAISDFVYKHTSMLPTSVQIVDHPQYGHPNHVAYLNFTRDVDGTPVTINFQQANIQTRMRT